MNRTTGLGDLPSRVAVAERTIAIEDTTPLEGAREEEEPHRDVEIEPREELIGWEMPPDRIGKQCSQRLVHTKEDFVRRFSDKRQGEYNEKAQRRCPLTMVSDRGRRGLSEDLR